MKSLWKFGLVLILVGFAFVGWRVGIAEQVQAAEQDSFKKYGQEFKGKIGKSYAESKEWWPSSPKPPAGTPNVIIFLLDDTGFGHLVPSAG